MATTVSLDAKNVLTIVTDQAYAPASVTIGVDTIPFSIPVAVPKFTGATPRLLTNDAASPKTTFTYQL